MAQEPQKLTGFESQPAIPEAASVPENSSRAALQAPPSDSIAGGKPASESPPGRTAAPETVATAIGPGRDIEHPNSTVILDEANDLLVISEAGALLPSTEGGWADAVVAGRDALSQTTASWAQEILATEAESADAQWEETSPLSKECTEQGGGEEAPQCVDWIDW